MLRFLKTITQRPNYTLQTLINDYLKNLNFSPENYTYDSSKPTYWNTSRANLLQQKLSKIHKLQTNPVLQIYVKKKNDLIQTMRREDLNTAHTTQILDDLRQEFHLSEMYKIFFDLSLELKLARNYFELLLKQYQNTREFTLINKAFDIMHALSKEAAEEHQAFKRILCTPIRQRSVQANQEIPAIPVQNPPQPNTLSQSAILPNLRNSFFQLLRPMSASLVIPSPSTNEAQSVIPAINASPSNA